MVDTALPTNVNYFTVIGQFGTSNLITGDSDGVPNFTPAAGLQIQFIAGVDAVLDRTASPNPVAIEMVPINCITDGSGYLLGANSVRGVTLMNPNNSNLSPNGWTWTVTFRRAGAKVAAFRDFVFTANAGDTIDLNLIMPVPSSTGTSLSAAQSAEAAAVAAASSAVSSATAAAGSATSAASSASASAASAASVSVDTLAQAGTAGKVVMKSATQTDVRAAFGATATGSAMIVAADAATARTAIGAGTAGSAVLSQVDGGEGWASKVILRSEDMAVGCASDGTADATTDWFYQMWTRFLVARPWLDCNYRVWSNVTQAYTATVALKAGTGTQVIEVYNASHAASTTLAYHQTRLAAMYPVPLDVLFVASGLYYGADEPAVYIPKVDAFITAFRAVQPQAGIVVVSQNPMITPVGATAIGQHLRRMAALRAYAAARAFGYMPIVEAFNVNLADAATYIGTDGIVPTFSGYSLWSRTAANHLEGLTWQ